MIWLRVRLMSSRLMLFSAMFSACKRAAARAGMRWQQHPHMVANPASQQSMCVQH